jgi:hypothetical protein
MEVANRFADGEDAYNNKMARSPEVDIVSRQRRRSHIEDSHPRQNQIAQDMKEWTRKAMEAEGPKTETVVKKKSQSTPARRQKTCSMDPAVSTMHI